MKMKDIDGHEVEIDNLSLENETKKIENICLYGWDEEKIVGDLYPVLLKTGQEAIKLFKQLIEKGIEGEDNIKK